MKRSLRDIRDGSSTAYFFDFTAAAERLGFKRIPAWPGWQRRYNRRELWHYQRDEGPTWAEAMAEIRNEKPTGKTYGLNDRGQEVRKIQKRLNELGFLPADGILELGGEIDQILQRTGDPVEPPDDDAITLADVTEQFLQPGPFRVGARRSVGEDPLRPSRK